MTMQRYRGWGFQPQSKQQAIRLQWRDDIEHPLSDPAYGKLLPFGNGRSYGDSCINSAGNLIDAIGLNRFLAFDSIAGVLCAEAGVTLADVQQLIVPHGWFLPVSPGTAFVTLGGAVANDVHGKNHHRDGTIGRHVKQLVLHRSDQEPVVCSDADNAQLFSATIGGLGLTGFISSVTIQLLSIKSSKMDVRVDAFQGLQAFSELSKQRKNEYQYTVAWLDCAAKGARFARGIFLSANHAKSGELDSSPITNKVSIPFSLPAATLNAFSIKAFNRLYYYQQAKRHQQKYLQDYESYFYPLDAVANWNRIYGASGFYQYQFVVPLDSLGVLESILVKIVKSGMASFLSVLKEFGDLDSPGMLSFPREGYCLALDFANRGRKTEQLISMIDSEVMDCGGAAYPAKDRLMSAVAFQQYFPRMHEFESFIDPKFTSDFWERVSA